MKKAGIIGVFLILTLVAVSAVLFATKASAENEPEAVLTSAVDTGDAAQAADPASGALTTKAIAAAAVVGIAAAAGAVAMALSIRKSTESMARQPEAAGQINSAMMLGLVFIETAIIYALIVAILIIFVL